MSSLLRIATALFTIGLFATAALTAEQKQTTVPSPTVRAKNLFETGATGSLLPVPGTGHSRADKPPVAPDEVLSKTSHKRSKKPAAPITDAGRVQTARARNSQSTAHAGRSSVQAAAGPVVIFVDADAGGLNDGTSWTNAYNEIYDAMADMAIGQGPVQVWVAEGTYHVAGTPARSDSLSLVNDTEIFGGFVGTEVTLGDRTANPLGNVTVLTGDINGDDIIGTPFVNTSDNVYHVVEGIGVDSTATLDGFHILAGKADGGGIDNNGAGLYLSSSDAFILRCNFFNNDATGIGGGVYVTGGSPTFINCVPGSNRAFNGGGAAFVGGTTATLRFFSPQGNEASFFGGGLFIGGSSDVSIDTMILWHNDAGSVGGGLALEFSTAVISNASVFNNTAPGGGGFYLADAVAVAIVNSSVSGNAATGDGGAIFNSSSSPQIQNCWFSGNTAGDDGGAIHTDGKTADPKVVNTTIYGNIAGDQAGGVFRGTGTFTCRNCILWRNRDSGPTDLSAQFNAGVLGNSIVQGLGGPVGSSFDSDPLFADPDGANGRPGDPDDDFRLLAGSPAIDAGNNGLILSDAADLDGDMNTAEQTPLDYDDIARRKDDPFTVDTGTGTAPIVDIGPFEYFNDCNFNGTPDDEEAPFECVEWVGFCAEPGNEDHWTCFDNWDVPGDFYPDEDGSPGSIAGVSVTLPAGADVFLDEDVTVPWLYIKQGATLRVGQQNPNPFLGGNLSFVDPAFFRVDGTLLVSADRTIGAPDDLVGHQDPQPMIVGPEGVYEKNPDPYLPGVTATAYAFDLFIEPGQCDPIARSGGSVTLSESMGFYVSNDLHVIGATPASCAIAGGVNPPPVISAGGNSRFVVAGTLYCSGAIESAFIGDVFVSVGGDFRNESVDPEHVDWTDGTLILSGLEPSQTFEVAGDDVGASNNGFHNGTDFNFSMNRLEIVEDADVTFVNNFRNTVGDGPCEEALYVDTLVFQPGADVTIDDCKVYYHTLFPNGVVASLNGCGALVPIGAASEEPPTAGANTCYVGSMDTGVSCASDGDCSGVYESFSGVDNPDAEGPEQPVIDSINITSSFPVTDVNVGVVIEHTWVGDLVVTLEHNGRTATIVDRAGVPASSFGCNSNNFDIVLDDEGGGGPIESLCGVDTDDLTPTSPPNYTPNEPLSTFFGMDANGPWRLYVSDNAGQDVGKLVSWSLAFNNGVKYCTGGSNDGQPCEINADCPGGVCDALIGAVCESASRYIGVTLPGAVTAGTMRTIKVTPIEAPLSRNIEGDVWWAGAPTTIPNTPNPSLNGAPLMCTDNPTASSLPVGAFYLYGGAIMPGAMYEVRLCDANGRNCSNGLNVETGLWGDVVAGFGGESQPNFGDITALVDKFKDFLSAPDAFRSDLVPELPDQVTNFADISADVDAFKGSAYPFSASTCP